MPKDPIILAWTKYNGRRMMRDYLQPNAANLSSCAEKCFYSDCKNLYAKKAVVTIFHDKDLDVDDLPPDNPERLNVFFSEVTPKHSRDVYKNIKGGYFNLTMTYRQDSDIASPLDEFVRIGVNATREECWKQGECWSQREVENIASKKTELAIQILDDCKTDSKRENYVEELKKFMKINQYGACFDKNCSGQNCLKEIDKHHFILAFEDTVCKHYTSPEFWYVKRLIVPVVLSANSLDGTEIPNTAYIAASDYPNPELLAEKLITLRNNTDEKYSIKYTDYFQWTQTYKKIKRPDNRLCELCKWAVYKWRNEMEEIHKWWECRAKCRRGYADHWLLNKPIDSASILLQFSIFTVFFCTSFQYVMSFL
ncbi:glycosyltransferase family 10 (fucosyltransferase) c-term domain-containing protein [Ditylenchus destructor]|uniref:Fucosyltransferase n=1 Tax=Ditylenchus destructor TaxID=166010 RepID=A0AAD4NJK7_9BILA|nr:glycosyltransferase family 10 (fucosyltransferase) c-term domain-containing protein [Ditylenchus destructor]